MSSKAKPPRPFPRVPPPPKRYDEPTVTVDFPLNEQPTGQTPGLRAQHAGAILSVFDKVDDASAMADLAELVSLYGASPARRRIMLAVVRAVAES